MPHTHTHTLELRWVTDAPRSTKSLATLKLPHERASCRGVTPSHEGPPGSILRGQDQTGGFMEGDGGLFSGSFQTAFFSLPALPFDAVFVSCVCVEAIINCH